jgi:hypothetical protein
VFVYIYKYVCLSFWPEVMGEKCNAIGKNLGNTQELGECRKISLRDLLSEDLLFLLHLLV